MSSRGHRSLTSDDQSDMNNKTRELSSSSTDSFMTTTTTTKSISTFYKFAFFNNKLGLIFKIYDGKITLVKIDHASSTNHDDNIEFEEIPGYKTEIMDKLLEMDENSFGKKHGKKNNDDGSNSLVELYSDEESDEDEKETKSKQQIMEDLEKQQSQQTTEGIAEGIIEEEGDEEDNEREDGISSRAPQIRRSSQRNEQESSKSSPLPPVDTSTPVVPPKVKKLEYSEIAFSSSESHNDTNNYMHISGSAKVRLFHLFFTSFLISLFSSLLFSSLLFSSLLFSSLLFSSLLFSSLLFSSFFLSFFLSSSQFLLQIVHTK
jgi:hypothetical protein